MSSVEDQDRKLITEPLVKMIKSVAKTAFGMGLVKSDPNLTQEDINILWDDYDENLKVMSTTFLIDYVRAVGASARAGRAVNDALRDGD